MTTTTPTGISRPLDISRLNRAKKAYTTRYLDLSQARTLLLGAVPRPGDVVLARVEAIGQHPRIEQRDGRRATLFVGDEVVVAYGDRYAPDQFEAAVPADLGPCDLVAAGGIAGRVEVAHPKMAAATRLAPVGLLVDEDGQRVNLSRGALPVRPPHRGRRPVTVAVAGAAMNAGKTTSAAHLVRGLVSAGLRVGAAKVTGTGAGGDVWLLGDAGAFPVYDFTSAGLTSTYRVGRERVLDVFTTLTDQLAADGCEAVVIEVADGVYQAESSALLQSRVFAERVDGLLFAASDALGACAGGQWLSARGLAPLALCGMLSASPLASREADAATGRPVWSLERLRSAQRARDLYEQLREGGTGMAKARLARAV